MKIAIIIVHYGLLTTTKSCLDSLRTKIGDFPVFLVNNTSEDLSSLIKIIPNTHLIQNDSNLGFAKAVNLGIKQALQDKKVDGIFLMNNDTTLGEGSFKQLELVLNKIPSAGIASPILHHASGYDWGGSYNSWTGMVKHKNWNNKPKTVLSVQHVAGAGILITRKLINKIGLFDERFFLYYEDLDYCLRALDNDFTIHITPTIALEHATSSGSSSTTRTKYQWLAHLRFVNKHLFKHAYPTAYLYTIFLYPLFIIKSFFSR